GGRSNPDVMLAGATTARWHYDFSLAERLARAAVGRGAGFDAELLAAQLAGVQGRSAQAGEGLPGRRRKGTHGPQPGRLAVSWLDSHMIYLGLVGDGLQAAEEAEGRISDTSWRHEIRARRAAVLLGVEGPAAASQAVEPLVREATGRALVWACLPGAFCLA